ncbi:apolipoprotein N-acyltransferase 1 [Spirochaetia bacterium]|nr:apolipoprotein N-acyltransferase 1 [Spirochaetia bacterium]
MIAPSNRFRRFGMHLAAILLASLLFAASFPNMLFSGGIPFLAWVAYAPLFWVIRRVNLGASVFWGALYGYGAYSLFNYWLHAFNPVAGIVVGVAYLLYFAVLCPLFKLAVILFPRRGYILQWLIWIAYEYLRTLGFLGYPYGITGYSQWSVLPLIQIADTFGVWGVSALVVFPSCLIAAVCKDLGSGKGEAGLRPLLAELRSGLRRERFPLLLWGCALIGTVVYGFVTPTDYSDEPTARIALVQTNTDPWRTDLRSYRENYLALKRLSLEALVEGPKPDLVVWSETAFVPRIYWHTTYRDDGESWDLVKELLDFLKTQEVPYVIGNDDARRKLNDQGRWERVDYNGVLLFDRGELVNQYRKLHLVPFTEYFPYEKQLPWVYQWLLKADTHLWEPGEDLTVFEINGLKFAAPICFEDVFGYLSRDFVRGGAEIIVNLSNDAWSNSLPGQMQHLGMAVFRAVENRRSMVRSTASGQTCGIAPSGRIIAMAEPFTEAHLTVEVPILRGETPYTRYGDLWAQVFVAAAAGMLLIGIVRGIMRRLVTKDGKK